MEKEWLLRELAEGRSITAIARERRCDPSTVAYWVNKHGLASGRQTKVVRGGLEEADLRALVEQGMSIRQIAAARGLSPTAVRYWLGRFGLTTQPARYVRRDASRPDGVLRECGVHGWSTFRRIGRAGAYRCTRCASERVAARRRRLKEILVAEAGGACRLCGYDRYPGALQFHHVDRAQKRFQLGGRGVTRSLESLREEARTCVLLCANCHAEVEASYRPADTSAGTTVRRSGVAQR